MNNFAGLSQKFSQADSSRIVILPIPFDKTTSWLSGASRGPRAILEASEQVELYDIETKSEVYKQGIFTAPPIKADTSEKMIKAGYQKTLAFLKNKKFVVALGGDHSVSIGPVKAHAEFFGDISILHLDAHSDRRDSYEDNRLSHACVIARAKEFIDNIVSVGIRSMDVSEVDKIDSKKMFFAENIVNTQENWTEQVINQLSDKVYITLDVDVFDSGIIPATGTPEPGGLNWYHVINLLKAVCKKKNVIGLDVVELLPSKINKAPDFLVAKLIYQFLSYQF